MRDEFIQGILARDFSTSIFISSHDLGEIESFASHIGYVDGGVLQFSEELESLNTRFREIVLTFDQPAAPPRDWPAEWLKPEISSGMIRFVDSQYEEHRTAAAIARVFPRTAQVEVTAVPLRSIFVAMAKSSKAAA